MIRIAMRIGRTKSDALPLVLAVVTAFSLCGCADKIAEKKFKEEVPDEFYAAFVTGDICLPSTIATGTTAEGGAPNYPIRIETCIYRCIEVDRDSVRWHYAWQCNDGVCYMALLITGYVKKVKGEKECDPRDLPDPPKSECTNMVFEYLIDPPCCMDEGDGAMYADSTFVVAIPYLDLAQGQEVIERLESGESVHEAAAYVVGAQNFPERQFTVDFDPIHPTLSSHEDLDALGAAACHHIPAP
jgi:hypothetical protein